MARRQSKDPLERYWSWPWQTRALLKYGQIPSSVTRAIEPCAGAGWMLNVLWERFSYGSVAAFDIEPAREDISRADTYAPGFFEQVAERHERRSIALVTNPPFSLASGYQIRGSLFAYTALLVRITWLEPTAEREYLRSPDRVIVLPRSKFGGPAAKNKSDSATAAWMIWGDVEPGIVRVTRDEKTTLERALVAA